MSVETISAIPLKSVEMNEVTSIKDYWSETMKELKISPSKVDIIIGKDEEKENEMKLEVIFERPEEPQLESKEDQPLVLVKPPTLPRIFVEFKKEVEVKERSQIFYTADTFMLDDQDATKSFVIGILDWAIETEAKNYAKWSIHMPGEVLHRMTMTWWQRRAHKVAEPRFVVK
ncbi:hypothetical protein Sjap_008103 [Stephania japonica]|uniref:Uncharacterized protein n=1 Tax=Stephania japonica TaxID=461633 RepID=A0AAP0JPI4_9MAGN